jgi:hypothetical protein
MPGQKARSAVFAPNDPGIHDAWPQAKAFRKLMLSARPSWIAVQLGLARRFIFFHANP